MWEWYGKERHSLDSGLKTLAQAGDAFPSRNNGYGQMYVAGGRLEGPSGRDASVTTVWILRDDEDSPRLVTAYPEVGIRSSVARYRNADAANPKTPCPAYAGSRFTSRYTSSSSAPVSFACSMAMIYSRYDRWRKALWMVAGRPRHPGPVRRGSVH